MASAHKESLLWIVAQGSTFGLEFQSLGIKCREVSLDAVGLFDMQELMTVLFQEGIRSLLVEGGARTYEPFINESLVNRIYLFQAPVLLKGAGRIPWFPVGGGDKDWLVKDVRLTNLDPDWLVEMDLP